jgi:hypothetical protein
MPVNMDPAKRRRKARPAQKPSTDSKSQDISKTPAAFGEETEKDREKDLADAEWKNLWDATEVIDMDKW